ncbi:MAG: radical SAM protein [Candidatus Absconditabacterales bacterium]|nr:radical SAM protein [Candidatus Absconditabacterales bacterium]
MLSLYIHLPFCHRQCQYCSFTIIPIGTTVSHQPLVTDYITTLCTEIEERGLRMGPRPLIRTIYFGGGTPSLLDPHDIMTIYETIKKIYDLTALEEICIECNPDPHDHVLGFITTLSSYRNNHVKIRRSIGIQTFDPLILRESGRGYTFGSVADFLRQLAPLARQATISLCLDFIAFGRLLPEGKTKKLNFWSPQARDFFGKLLQSHVFDHISLYALELFEGSPWFHELPDDGRLISGKNKYGDDDAIYQEYSTIKARLYEAGYHRYELSNYSLLGKEGLHNMQYRTMQDYIGVGIGASSAVFSPDSVRRLSEHRGITGYVGGYRRTNPKTLATRRNPLMRQSKRLITTLSSHDKQYETIMLGLRRREGVSIDVFHHAEGVVVPEWQTIMQELITHDYVTEINGYYRLTDRGMDIYNTIITQLLG